MKFMVLNGPNMNLLGIREPEIYGSQTYDDLLTFVEVTAKALGHEVHCFQSNHEGALIDQIQQAWREGCHGLVINPAAWTHYSFALHDALKSVPIPTVEVHLTDIHKREAFRRHSVTAPACILQISGEGFDGYRQALIYLADWLKEKGGGTHG